MGAVKNNFPYEENPARYHFHSHTHRCSLTVQFHSTVWDPEYEPVTVSTVVRIQRTAANHTVHIPDALQGNVGIASTNLDFGLLISRIPPCAFSSLLVRHCSRKGSRAGCILAHESLVTTLISVQFSLNSAHLERTI